MQLCFISFCSRNHCRVLWCWAMDILYRFIVLTWNHIVIAYAELEGTHQGHQVQLLDQHRILHELHQTSWTLSGLMLGPLSWGGLSRLLTTPADYWLWKTEQKWLLRSFLLYFLFPQFQRLVLNANLNFSHILCLFWYLFSLTLRSLKDFLKITETMLKHKPEVDHGHWAPQLTLTRENYSEHAGHTCSKHNFVTTSGFESLSMSILNL